MNTLDKRLKDGGDIMPTCLDYAFLLRRIMKKEGIDDDTAREKCGNLTYRQWRDLLDEENDGTM